MNKLAKEPINLAMTCPALPCCSVAPEMACLLFIAGGLAAVIVGDGNSFYGLLV